MDNADTTATPQAAVRRPRGRRGCWLFLIGLLAGMVGIPLLLWLVLLLTGDAVESLSPATPRPGQPDLTINLGRGYIQRSAEEWTERHSGMLTVSNPVVVLDAHPEGGARLIVRGHTVLPLIRAPIAVGFHLAAVDGRLGVATESIGLGSHGQLPLPAQSLIKDWLDDLINQEVQARIRSQPGQEIIVTDVSASEEQLIVEATLKDH